MSRTLETLTLFNSYLADAVLAKLGAIEKAAFVPAMNGQMMPIPPDAVGGDPMSGAPGMPSGPSAGPPPELLLAEQLAMLNSKVDNLTGQLQGFMAATQNYGGGSGGGKGAGNQRMMAMMEQIAQALGIQSTSGPPGTAIAGAGLPPASMNASAMGAAMPAMPAGAGGMTVSASQSPADKLRRMIHGTA